MLRTALLLFALLLPLAACDQSPPTAEAPVQKATRPAGTGLLNVPEQPATLELASHALPLWRQQADARPTLAIFSFDPFLKPIPEALRERATELVKNGSEAAIEQHGSINRADPVILPNQTVSAALRGGLLSAIYWVFPSKIAPQQLDLGKFREQMVEQKFLTSEEAAALELQDGVLSGTVRGIPFYAVHPTRLDFIKDPGLLHIDMSYFRGLYDNEIKTPLYNLLKETADNLRAQSWQPQITTLSYSTLDGDTSLDVRFVMSDLAELIRNPALLDGDMPQEWRQRSEALYAADMFSESKRIELAKQLIQVAPESASAHYDRFQALLHDKQIDPALQALEQAVKRDPGYGAAYISLAQMAVQDKRPAIALSLLNHAAQLFPDNPFIGLQEAHLLADQGDVNAARAKLDSLPQHWSPVYHQEIPEVIEKLRDKLNDSETPHEEKN